MTMSCGFCRAILSDGDRHLLCASCLGKDHADHALADGGCQECESLPLSTLRARQALFRVKSASSMPSVGPRRKKRHSQRPPEPSVKENSPATSPRASFSKSPVSFLDGQRPAAVEMTERDAMEEDSCSLLVPSRPALSLPSLPSPPRKAPTVKSRCGRTTVGISTNRSRSSLSRGDSKSVLSSQRAGSKTAGSVAASRGWPSRNRPCPDK